MKIIHGWLKLLRQPLPREENERHVEIFFLLSFTIFATSQLFLTAAPALTRKLPVEEDDAYGYILKAEEIRAGCFLQDCPALNDLREQFTAPTNNLDAAYFRAREYHRIFVVYHPLHSLLMLSLETGGLSYEGSYALLAFVGKLIICAGIAIWLRIIYGSGAAGITLLLLSPIVFIGQGIHVVVPSNMALGIALLLWAVIVKKGKKSGIFLLAGVPCIVLLHPVGKIYSLISVVLFVVRTGLPMSKRDLTFAISSIGIVLASLGAPYIIKTPELNFDPFKFFPSPWNMWTEIQGGLGESLRIVNTFFASFNWAIIPVFAMIFGFLFMDPVRRRICAFVALVLAGFLISSLFYVVPWFGQFVFQRAWVPMALFLFGLIGSAIASAIQKITQKVRQSGTAPFKRLISAELIIPYAAIAMVLFSMITYIPFYLRHYFLTLESAIDDPAAFFNSAQPEMVFSNMPEDHRVLYTTETGLYAYLTYGGLQHGAVFYPAIKGTSDENTWIHNQASPIDFVVVGNEAKLYELAEDLMIKVEVLEANGISVLARVIH